jgi:hypothetical protein
LDLGAKARQSSGFARSARDLWDYPGFAGTTRNSCGKAGLFVGLAWEIGLIKRDFSDPKGFTACLLERLMMIVERAGEEGDISQGDRFGVLGMQALDLEMGDHAERFLAEAADIAAEVLSQLRAPDVRSFLEQAMVLIKPVGGLPEARAALREILAQASWWSSSCEYCPDQPLGQKVVAQLLGSE